jgi:hypothetical protein
MFLGSKVWLVLRADSLITWGVKCGRCVGLTTLLPSLSRLSRQCAILNILQPYRPPRPVMGIALLYGDGVCFL